MPEDPRMFLRQLLLLTCDLVDARVPRDAAGVICLGMLK